MSRPEHLTATCHTRRALKLARMTDFDNSKNYMPRRFPPPWSVEEADPKLDRRCFIVRDANGQALAYVYFENGSHR